MLLSIILCEMETAQELELKSAGNGTVTIFYDGKFIVFDLPAKALPAKHGTVAAYKVMRDNTDKVSYDVVALNNDGTVSLCSTGHTDKLPSECVWYQPKLNFTASAVYGAGITETCRFLIVSADGQASVVINVGSASIADVGQFVLPASEKIDQVAVSTIATVILTNKNNMYAVGNCLDLICGEVVTQQRYPVKVGSISQWLQFQENVTVKLVSSASTFTMQMSNGERYALMNGSLSSYGQAVLGYSNLIKLPADVDYVQKARLYWTNRPFPLFMTRNSTVRDRDQRSSMVVAQQLLTTKLEYIRLQNGELSYCYANTTNHQDIQSDTFVTVPFPKKVYAMYSMGNLQAFTEACPAGQGYNGVGVCAKCLSNEIAIDSKCTKCPGNMIVENNGCTCKANYIMKNNNCTKCPTNLTSENNFCVLPVRQNLVQVAQYPTKCPYNLSASFITIHNSDHDLSADQEVRNMLASADQSGYHYMVDDLEAVQMIPNDRNAFHAGDGNSGPGNRQSFSVCICNSKSGGVKYTTGEDKAARIVAQLMHNYNVKIENVVQHNKWNGADCPARMRAEGRWNSFIKKVNKYKY